MVCIFFLFLLFHLIKWGLFFSSKGERITFCFKALIKSSFATLIVLFLHNTMTNLHQLIMVTVLLPEARSVIPNELQREQWNFSAGAVQSVITGNVRCLDNSMDKPRELIKTQRERSECTLTHFMQHCSKKSHICTSWATVRPYLAPRILWVNRKWAERSWLTSDWKVIYSTAKRCFCELNIELLAGGMCP